MPARRPNSTTHGAATIGSRGSAGGFSMPNVNRRLLAEIEDGLIPALQDRGLVRSAYGHAQFRDNLLEY